MLTVFNNSHPKTEFQAIVYGAAAGSHSQSISSSPNIRFILWIACPDAPLTRLSIVESSTALLFSLSDSKPISQKLEPLTAVRDGIPEGNRIKG